MNAPAESTAPRASANNDLARRIAVSVILSLFVFLALWVTALSFATSLLVGFSFCVIILIAGATLGLIEMVLDAIATIIFGVLAAIVAVIAAVFSIFW